MKSREIMEAFRRGRMNEQKMTEFLIKLNEKCEDLYNVAQQQQHVIVHLTKLIDDTLKVNQGVRGWVQGMAKRMGFDEKTLTNMVGSEAPEPRKPDFGDGT